MLLSQPLLSQPLVLRTERKLPLVRSARKQLSFDHFPEDMMIEILRSLDATAVMSMCSASRGLKAMIEREGFVAEVVSRRLRWLPCVTTSHEISNFDFSLIRKLTAENAGFASWGAAQVLRLTGRSSWQVRIDHCFLDDGDLTVGVCDETATCGWGLNLKTGNLYRDTRTAEGRFACMAPPAAYPDGDGTQICAGMCGKASGTVVEVVVDHTAGLLSFGLQGRFVTALSGFPAGAALRPMVRSVYPGDQVTLVSPCYCHEK